jgi:hypothetical protein
MKNKHVSTSEERQFITKEFADTLAGKIPSPYLRLHDPVQKGLFELAASRRAEGLEQTAYCERMIHFWREVSLAGLPRAGRGLDQCYALLFECAFDLAEAEPDWAIECLAKESAPKPHVIPLEPLARQISVHARFSEISHSILTTAFCFLYAPFRERERKWSSEVEVALSGDSWFWAAILCSAGIGENYSLWPFRCALADASADGWRDGGHLHLRLIREAPQRALTTPRLELMGHPILRIARLKYREGSIEQTQVLRFLNAQCIKQGFESEEDYFGSDLTLAQWVRDAREWAANMLDTEPEIYQELFYEAGEEALDRTRSFYHQHLGSDPARVDSLDATAALIKWAKLRRGFQFSQYRAQIWEFVVEIADAALWLGWLIPSMDEPEQ